MRNLGDKLEALAESGRPKGRMTTTSGKAPKGGTRPESWEEAAAAASAANPDDLSDEISF
jgi:hypothetical protein